VNVYYDQACGDIVEATEIVVGTMGGSLGGSGG